MRLTQLIAQYVTFRKSLAQDFESNEWRLRTFSRFVGESVAVRSVKPRQVAAFLAGRGPITRYGHVKYGALRGFSTDHPITGSPDGRITRGQFVNVATRNPFHSRGTLSRC